MTPAASEFWRRVVSGQTRLTLTEDRLVWRMRGFGHDWDTIATTIRTLRRRPR